MTIALIPAAGKSTRMGRPKLALPVGRLTVLELLIAALRRAEVADILVVVGPDDAELQPLAESAGALVLVLSEETADMRATIEKGLEYVEKSLSPRPDDCWLLVPADHPTLAPEAVRQLLQTPAAYPDHSIFIPTFQGQRGHPALIAWRHVAGIRALPAGLGLNAYCRQQAAQTLEVPVDSEEILYDLDSPEDYRRLLSRHEDSGQPMDAYQLYADTVGGIPSLRWQDNLYQGVAILAGLVLGAIIGLAIGGDSLGAVVGGLAGLVLGLLASGTVLMVLGWVRAARHFREGGPSSRE